MDYNLQGWKYESKNDSQFFGSYQTIANHFLNVFASFSVLTENCKSLYKWIANCDSQIVRTGAPYCIKLL